MCNGSPWFGEEGKEAIVISNGDYLLLEYESKRMTNLGNKTIEVKQRLKDIGKDKNFTDFMNEQYLSILAAGRFCDKKGQEKLISETPKSAKGGVTLLSSGVDLILQSQQHERRAPQHAAIVALIKLWFGRMYFCMYIYMSLEACYLPEVVS